MWSKYQGFKRKAEQSEKKKTSVTKKLTKDVWETKTDAELYYINSNLQNFNQKLVEVARQKTLAKRPKAARDDEEEELFA